MPQTLAKLKLKKSGTSTVVPSNSLLELGELALNYADGKLFYKDADGDIAEYFPIDETVYIFESDLTAGGPLVLGAAHNNMYVRFNAITDVIISIRADIVYSFDLNTVITFFQVGNGKGTITVDGGVTLNYKTGTSTNGQNSVIQMIKVAANTWDVLGGVL